jgi:hypothetical protein
MHRGNSLGSAEARVNDLSTPSELPAMDFSVSAGEDDVLRPCNHQDGVTGLKSLPGVAGG